MPRFRNAVAIFAAALMLPATLAAQASPRVQFGLVGGLNLSSMTDMGGSAEFHPGFAIGAFAHRSLNDTWALQVEAHYTGKGVESKESGVTAKLEVDYIELPIIFRGTMSGSGKAHPFFDLGVAPAFKTGCSASASGGGVSVSLGCGTLNGIESFDTGILGGVGLAFPVGGRTMTASARYTFGMLNVNKDMGMDTPKVNHRNLQFLLGFPF